MSLIKPRARGKHRVQHRTRLDRENHETLYAYAAFIGEDVEYVLNELIDSVLAKDKEFVSWRAEHKESFAPRAQVARTEGPRQTGREMAARPSPRADTPSIPS